MSEDKGKSKQTKKSATPRQKAWIKFKARTLRDIFVATGKIDTHAAAARCFPNTKPGEAQKVLGVQKFDEAVMLEFEKMIKVDPKAIAQLDNNRVLKELLEDLNRLNLILESGEITVDEAVRVVKAKGEIVKMLGMSQGTWRPESGGKDEPKEDVDGLLKRLGTRFN